MPPRYVYWTIIVDGQPTAFRSGSLEDIMPTFNRVKEKQPTAELKWFQNGQLWPSRQDAQDFMRARGERGRQRDPRQSTGGAGGEKPERAWNAKPEWKTRTTFKPRGDKPAWKPTGEKPAWVPKGTSSPKPQAPSRSWSDERPEWKPKGTFKPKEPGHASGWGEKPGRSSSPKPQAPSRSWSDKPAWKPASAKASTFAKAPADRSAWQAPKGSARDQARASFRPKSYSPKPDDGMTRSSRVQSRDAKLEWKPKGSSSPKPQAPSPEGKRKWVPKAEYKKSLGIEAKRDDKWRPGGEHKDPKQKYKDAKKAKWTKFKATIRARSSKPRKRDES